MAAVGAGCWRCPPQAEWLVTAGPVRGRGWAIAVGAAGELRGGGFAGVSRAVQVWPQPPLSREVRVGLPTAWKKATWRNVPAGPKRIKP